MQQSGKIRGYGVSNFDVDDLEEAIQLNGGNGIATNQVLYNLMRRGVEWDLLPWCQHHYLPIMAYSPLEQGRLLPHPTLKTIARSRGVSVAQVAIAWLLHQPDVIVIPKSSRIEHVEQNYGALNLQLSSGELTQLDAAFPPPVRSVALEML